MRFELCIHKLNYTNQIKKNTNSIDIFKYINIMVSMKTVLESESEVMQISTVDAVSVFRALGDEARLDIVRQLALAERPMPGCDVVCACQTLSNLSQPTTSHHFSKLTKAGIVLEEKDGTQKKYRLNRSMFERMGIDVDKV
jgi:DNA-binding transcriptional ArsR family regulator